MAWIKRNLWLVISGVIALVFLGLGGFYLWSAIEKNKSIDGEISQTKSDIELLLNGEITPNQQNLKDAKEQSARLTAFVADAKKHFPPTPASGPLDALSFKTLLRTTVSGLQKQAESAGISLTTTNYLFTFDAQWAATTFAQESLHPLSERLHEVRFIAEVLFKSRINRLVGMRRAMVQGERLQGGGAGGIPAADVYLPVAGRSNPETGMALWPYEVTFICFTSELAAVMEGLQSAQYGFVVKSPVIEPDAETKAPAGRQPKLPNQPPLVRPVRPPVAGQPPPAAIPGAPVGLVTIVNEKPLRVTLRIEVIKPLSLR